jgi:cytochrome P450
MCMNFIRNTVCETLVLECPSKYVLIPDKQGPIVRSNPTEVDVSDIQAVRVIHRAGRAYLKSDWYLSLAPPGVRTLMNITDPDMHTAWRRLLGGPFQNDYLTKLEPVVSDKMALALDVMEKQMKERGCMDVLTLSLYMTLDIITEISYGASVNILQNQEENQYVMDYLNGLGPIHAIRTTMPTYVAIASWLRFPMFARLLNIGPRVNQWATETLRAYKSLLQDENPKPTLFTPLFANGEKGFTDRQILDLAGSNITAGTHTTASTLAFLVWAICRNTEIRDKVVAEVSQLRPDFKNQDVRELPYLNRVMKEAVRLYSGVPSVLPRTVPTGGAQFLGYFLPAGATVSTQCYSLHRRPDYYADPLR